MDNALKTFEAAQTRANYLLRLAVGITEHSTSYQSGAWLENFKRLMRWPKKHKIIRVVTGDAVFVLRESSTIKHEDFQRERTRDLLRAALVLSVSAMDAYYHAKIIRWLVTKAKGESPPPALIKSTITVGDFLAASKYKKPNVVMKNALEKNLYFQTFQQPERIADGLSLLGVKKFWEKVSKEMDYDTNELKKELNWITHRRNLIAHEGDLFKGAKAKNKSRKLSEKDVRWSLGLISNLVHASNTVINNNI